MVEPKTNTESISVWDYKPGWCQPWSIILSGVTAISGSWLALHNIWLTAIVSSLVVAWWVYFLVLYPKAFADYISSQQTKVN